MSKHQTASQETATGAITPEMQKMIDARAQGIREAHANCLIEGASMRSDVLREMLARAQEPVSNGEFKKREYALLFKRWGNGGGQHGDHQR